MFRGGKDEAGRTIAYVAYNWDFLGKVVRREYPVVEIDNPIVLWDNKGICCWLGVVGILTTKEAIER